MVNDDQMRQALFDAFQAHDPAPVPLETEALLCRMWEAVDHLFREVRQLKSVGHVHGPGDHDAPAFEKDGYSTGHPATGGAR